MAKDIIFCFHCYPFKPNSEDHCGGLKALILKDNHPSALYIYYFTHQLQLVLIVMANKYTNIETFFF